MFLESFPFWIFPRLFSGTSQWKKPEPRRPLLSLRDARRRPPWTMSGESTFVLDSTVSPARSFALSFDPGAFDTLMDTQTLLKETFGLAMPEARGSPQRGRGAPGGPTRRRRGGGGGREEDDGLVPYERERLERMRRNDEVMRRLGITESVNKLEGKAAPPPEKNPVIIIDDDEDDEAKNDTEDEDEEEEEDDDETGGIYGCNRCRFSRKGCYDTPDGKVKGATLTHTWDRCTSRVYLRGSVYLPMRPRRRGRSFTSTRSLPSSLRAPSDLVWFRQSTKAARLPGLTVQVRQKFLPSRRRKSSLRTWTALHLLTRNGRYAVHFWRRKGEWIRGKRSGYLGTVGTLKEAVEVYNKEARLLGKPTQEIPAGYVAPEPDVPPTLTQAPKHTSSPNDQEEGHHRPWIFRHQSYIKYWAVQGDDYGKPGRLYLGTVDTLREAVELYNKEAKKRGKPIQPLPDDKLDVPELNVQFDCRSRT